MRNNVKEIRESKLLTQSQLAQMMGVQPQTISNIENSRHRPRSITIRKLSIALGVPAEQLFSDEVDEIPAA